MIQQPIALKGCIIFIDALTYNKIKYVTEKYSKEFTSLLHCEYDESNNSYFIYDAYFPTQKNNATTTELDGIDIVKLKAEGADLTRLCGHIHSHVNMGVSPSDTDETEIRERVESGGDFSCSVIVNKKGELYGHVYDAARDRYFKKVPVEIVSPEYPIEAYETDLLKSIKEAESVEEVEMLMEEGYEGHVLRDNSLTKEQEEELDKEIKDKFSTFYHNYAKSNYKKNKKHNYGVNPRLKKVGNKPRVYDADYWDEIEDERDIRLPAKKEKNINEMTQEEYEDWMRDLMY